MTLVTNAAVPLGSWSLTMRAGAWMRLIPSGNRFASRLACASLSGPKEGAMRRRASPPAEGASQSTPLGA